MNTATVSVMDFTFAPKGAVRIVIKRHSLVTATMKVGQVLEDLGSQVYVNQLAARVLAALREAFGFLVRPYVKALPAAALDSLAVLWVEEMYSLVAQGDRDGAGELLYEKIDDLLLEGRLREVDHIIRLIDLQRLDSYTLVALLTITLWSKDELRYRATLVKRIEGHFARTDPGRVEGLMSGLR